MYNSITVPVHSVVDVITNSSTEIYTWPVGNAESLMRDILAEILKAAGVDKPVEDFFNIKMGPDPRWAKDVREWPPESIYIAESDEYFNEEDYEDSEEEWNALLEKYIAQGGYHEDLYCSGTNNILVVTPKNNTDINIVRMFENCFESHALNNY